MKTANNKIKKYISLFLCACALLLMLIPIGQITIESMKYGTMIKDYSYYSLFAFKYGIIFPFICMILTATTLVFTVLSHLKVVHPIAAFICAVSSFAMSLLYMLVDLKVTYLTSMVTILELAIVVFTFPLMIWIKEKE